MSVINFTDKVTFINSFAGFDGFIDGSLLRSLGNMLQAKEIQILCEDIDPSVGCWDGEMIIKFARVPKAEDLINKIIRWARADETSMISKKELRLWWD